LLKGGGAGDQKTLHNADVLGAPFGPGQQLMTTAQRNHVQCPLAMAGLDGDIEIVQIDRELLTPLAYLSERRDEGAAG
jgi:hypothetical protein